VLGFGSIIYPKFFSYYTQSSSDGDDSHSSLSPGAVSGIAIAIAVIVIVGAISVRIFIQFRKDKASPVVTVGKTDEVGSSSNEVEELSTTNPLARSSRLENESSHH